MGGRKRLRPIYTPKIPIAYPFVPPEVKDEVLDTLNSRWIGQGPKVDKFEQAFMEKFDVLNAVAVNSGTSALELAYDLIGIKPGDEVITPVLTCTATNLPLVRRGAKIVFADIKRDNLTIDPADIERKITAKTKAIVVVDLNGIQATRKDFYYITTEEGVVIEKRRIPVVVDAAQALGNFGGDYTCCSFQAIKLLTTGDGGMLICKSPEDAKKAKLWRWFGIDRELKIKNNWQPYKQREILFDIEYPGYKFQMNDIAASLGLWGLIYYDQLISERKYIFELFKDIGLPMVDGVNNKYGYACLLVEDRDIFTDIMDKYGVETNVMQVRNDIYKVFEPFKTNLPNMDWVESRYICLPLHNKLDLTQIDRIIEAGNKYLHGKSKKN